MPRVRSGPYLPVLFRKVEIMYGDHGLHELDFGGRIDRKGPAGFYMLLRNGTAKTMSPFLVLRLNVLDGV